MVEVVKINLKEIDRLLYTVLAIENDCHILPQGAMRLTESHEVSRNAAFKGLNEKEFCNLKCYSHFRNVQSKVKAQALLQDDAVFQRNFLDDLD